MYSGISNLLYRGGNSVPPRKRPKVFGLGLSRTGTHSLTLALHQLGFRVMHYPIDHASLAAMMRGDGRFPLLEYYDGLTDVVTIPFLAELDALYPDARFILTVREKRSWLRSMEEHWHQRSVGQASRGESATHMHVRRFLRSAVYGCYEFNRERFARVYDEHTARVHAYFAQRPGDLLVLDICGGAGWPELAPFFGQVPPGDPFPRRGRTEPQAVCRPRPRG